MKKFSIEKVNMAEDLQNHHPSVFQCYRCKTIIGDSYALCTNQLPVGGQILLSNTTNTKMDHEALNQNSLATNEFKFVFCSNCGYEIGKVRLSNLPKSGDSTLVEIQSKNVITYKLGDDNVPVKRNRRTEENVDIENSLKCLNDEMLKVQHVLLDVIQRLNRLEEGKPQVS